MLFAVLLLCACVATRTALLQGRGRGRGKDTLHCPESQLQSHIRTDALLTGCLCVAWPCAALYYPLYYTDTLSMAMLVLTYWASMRGEEKEEQEEEDSSSSSSSSDRSSDSSSGNAKSLARALVVLSCASVAILVRQTNAAWCMFFAGMKVLRALAREGAFVDTFSLCSGITAASPSACINSNTSSGSSSSSSSSRSSSSSSRSSSSISIAKRRSSSSRSKVTEEEAHQYIFYIYSLIYGMKVSRAKLARDPTLWALLVPVLLFIIFVVFWNNGQIVLGDAGTCARV